MRLHSAGIIDRPIAATAARRAAGRLPVRRVRAVAVAPANSIDDEMTEASGVGAGDRRTQQRSGHRRRSGALFM
jgi:hypothetical protein